jgi:hypothetical protein
MPENNNTTTSSIEQNTVLTCSFTPCTEENVHTCRKCNRTYCVMHSNNFSPNFCQACFRNLQAIETKFNRVFEDYDTKTSTITIRRETHAKYYMDGMDWPFLGLWINRLTDDELRAWWIFHHSIMKLIEVENETRKIKKAKKLREQSIAIGGLVSKTTKTTSGTVRVIKTADTAEDVRKKLKKQGIPDTIIESMIKAMGVV